VGLREGRRYGIEKYPFLGGLISISTYRTQPRIQRKNDNSSRKLKYDSKINQDSNVTLMSVRVTTVTVEKQ